MGFGREKSTYCYFAVSAVLTSIPHDSYVRLFVAKSAIIITVADDFFDTTGCLNELEILTDAVQRYIIKDCFKDFFKAHLNLICVFL
jgi:geranyllinalool synthase